SGVCTAVGGGVGTDVGGGVGTGVGGFVGLTRGVAGTGVSATGVATLVGAEFGAVGAATQLASSVVAPPLSSHSTSRRLIRSLPPSCRCAHPLCQVIALAFVDSLRKRCALDWFVKHHSCRHWRWA